MILITGGGGLVGLNVAAALAAGGQKALLLQRHRAEPPSFLAPYWGEEVKLAVGDLLEPDFLLAAARESGVESVVHAAATWPGRDPSGDSLYDMISINVVASLHVLELARSLNLRRATFISSSTVYSGMDEAVVATEEMPLPLGPPHAIPATKKACEQLCGLYRAEGLSVAVLRVARVYGPASHWGRNPMERMVAGAVRGKRVEIADSHPADHTCPIYAKDCASAVALVHLKGALRHSTYNIADGNYATYAEIADLIRDLIPGADIRLTKKAPSTGGHPRVAIERIKAEGWRPAYADLREGLKAYIAYLKEGKY